MLEGLEVSVVSFKNLKENIEDFRIDSNFFLKEYLNLSDKVKDGFDLSNLSDTYELHSNGAFKDIFEYLHFSTEEDIPYIRSENVGDFFISKDLSYISKYAHDKLPKTQTRLGDILIARTGKIGGASIITEKWVNCNSNQNVVNIRIKNKLINPFYLNTFLNTKYGIFQFEKASTGNVQAWLNLSLLRKIKIVMLKSIFQNNIEQVVRSSYFITEKSNILYAQAEKLLLEELGLKDWQPSTENINEKSFKESFLVTGRLDAEHYQPKYEEIIDHIKEKDNQQLKTIVTIEKSIEPGSSAYEEDGIPFLRVSNLTKFELTQPDIYLNKEDYSDVIRPQKDTILFSKDGSIGIAYKVEEDLNSITSGAILHLKIIDKNVLPDYLTLILNSLIVKMQAERDAGGSIIQHWKPSEIEEVLIPIIDKQIQQKIASLVQESFSLKKQSEHLLEVAKQAVEIAIEQNEEIAMAYIEENTNEYKI